MRSFYGWLLIISLMIVSNAQNDENIQIIWHFKGLTTLKVIETIAKFIELHNFWRLALFQNRNQNIIT